MFALYLKSNIKNIIMFSIFSLIFAMVFYLYSIPLDAILYAALLSLVITIIFTIFNYIKFSNKHKKLKHIVNEITFNIDNLPEANNVLEEDYQNLIKTIYKDKVNLISIADNEKRDLLDYYTLWAHQIKTPIAAIKLLLQSDNPPKNSDLSMELFKIEQYVEMVLQYLRLNSNSTDFIFKQYDLDNIIKQAIRKYSKIFIGKKIKLKYSDLDCRVLTDEKWLVFVIEQLLSNSLKYTNTGSMSIYLEDPNSKILIIKDTGIGIAEEDLPHIFEKGFTGYNGRLDKKSTGIGLYLCNNIVNKLSHSITIESNVGEGTTVKLDLSSYNLIVE